MLQQYSQYMTCHPSHDYHVQYLHACHCASSPMLGIHTCGNMSAVLVHHCVISVASFRKHSHPAAALPCQHVTPRAHLPVIAPMSTSAGGRLSVWSLAATTSSCSRAPTVCAASGMVGCCGCSAERCGNVQQRHGCIY